MTSAQATFEWRCHACNRTGRFRADPTDELAVIAAARSEHARCQASYGALRSAPRNRLLRVVENISPVARHDRCEERRQPEERVFVAY
jgi:hypothetical protein